MLTLGGALGFIAGVMAGKAEAESVDRTPEADRVWGPGTYAYWGNSQSSVDYWLPQTWCEGCRAPHPRMHAHMNYWAAPKECAYCKRPI